jgi:hypothetical protein
MFSLLLIIKGAIFGTVAFVKIPIFWNTRPCRSRTEAASLNELPAPANHYPNSNERNGLAWLTLGIWKLRDKREM